jgi:hypothetical protein
MMWCFSCTVSKLVGAKVARLSVSGCTTVCVARLSTRRLPRLERLLGRGGVALIEASDSHDIGAPSISRHLLLME